MTLRFFCFSEPIKTEKFFEGTFRVTNLGVNTFNNGWVEDSQFPQQTQLLLRKKKMKNTVTGYYLTLC